MKVKENVLLKKLIHNGINYGYNRAFKHTETPTLNQIKDSVADNILTEISEYYKFKNKKLKEYSIIALAIDLGTDNLINNNVDILTMDENVAKKIIFNEVIKSIKKYFKIKNLKVKSNNNVRT